MLHGVIVCPNADLAAALEQALTESRMVRITRASYYPNPADLARILRQQEPQVIFLSFESDEASQSLLRTVEERAPNIALVAVGHSRDPDTLMAVMRAGIREYLSPPFEPDKVKETLVRVSSLLERNLPTGTNKVYSFLPAKPGVGASTVALHTSLSMARLPQTSVLLADFDLNNGMIGFMLRLNPQHSVIEAVEHAHEMDDELWSRLVTSTGQLDVLASGRFVPGHRIDASYLQPLMGFLRRNYGVVCVDLSGMMERFSVELMHESSRILLVCTPEVPALHLAAQKLRYLNGLELGGRVQVILNRAGKHSVLSDAEMQKLLGAPVYLTLPNDYACVHRAMLAGKGVEPASKLGKAFEVLARSLAEDAAPVQRKRARFLEYFSLGGENYSLAQR